MFKVRFATSRDMGLQEVEVFRSCWPMSDGFRASSWMAAQGRLLPSERGWSCCCSSVPQSHSSKRTAKDRPIKKL